MNIRALSMAACLIITPVVSGCAALAGGAAAAGGYEYTNKQQLDKLDNDYKAGNISKQEYLKRKQDIESGSVVY